ncbi:MAG: sigma-54-dependent Fis family transcriptional regulator, partial [Desulfobacterales bacterium]
FRLIETTGRNEILSIFEHQKPQLVLILSSKETLENELTAVKKIRGRDPQVPIIFLAKYSSEARAIAAFRAGVSDYFRVPFGREELLASVQKCLQAVNVRASAYSAASGFEGWPNPPMIGQSQPMQEVKAYLQKVAATDSTVMITGETGTGKELAAQLIHRRSLRGDQPFVCINSAALPENLVESELFGYDRGAFTGAAAAKPGKFELAIGGSVFLDEIGDMNAYAQAKILRSIESKEICRLGGKSPIALNVRVIAATNRDPEQLVAGGSFREDLYYRLNVARIHLPPLRERKEDIPELAAFALENLNRRLWRRVHGLTEEAMACLMRYDWPGNVRRTDERSGGCLHQSPPLEDRLG